MSTPYLDPTLPADHSPLSSGEMRGQFQAAARLRFCSMLDGLGAPCLNSNVKFVRVKAVSRLVPTGGQA